MKAIFFPLSYFLFRLVFLEASAGSFEDSQEVISLSKAPVAQRLSCMVDHCYAFLKKNGHIGISLDVFKDPQFSEFSYFPKEENSLRYLLGSFKENAARKNFAHEAFFLVLQSPSPTSIVADVWVESNYHRINDMLAVFRGEALCKRGYVSYHVPLESFPTFLSNPKYEGTISWAEACYARFLTRPVQDSLREFLILLVEKIATKRKTSRPSWEEETPNDSQDNCSQ